MAFSLLSLLLFSFSLLQPLSAAANLHQTTLFRTQLPSHSGDFRPTTYFEVTKPVVLPETNPCSHQILRHDFGDTYGKSPVVVEYSPPANCPSRDFAAIVLEWKAESNGTQFDRIFGVWLSGVELLRSCTVEPTSTGIGWTVEKDVTRYNSLLMTNQTLAVYLGNLVDETYTGVYHVNITIHFYPAGPKNSKKNVAKSHISAYGYGSGADLILPISRSLPLNSGLWFEIQNSTDTKSQEFKIPQNTYGAVLEVYVSFHEKDEFWYGNYPNDYIAANNQSGVPGNGPFREVLISLDDTLIGAIWPFTVIYTGGINPLLWRPITGIGSFNLPSYDIEMTPLVGTLLDGKTHEFTFSVTNALNVWYIDANLHIWLDEKSKKTVGKVLRHEKKKPLLLSSSSNFNGPDGTFSTTAIRSLSFTGWVQSSYGKITTKSIQHFNYTNRILMGNNGSLQIINQTIDFNDIVFAKTPSGLYTLRSLKRFPFYLYSNNIDKGNGSYVSVVNLTLGFNEKRITGPVSRILVSSVKNLQGGQGTMLVKGDSIINGLGSLQQVYSYKSDGFCYYRNISSSNYTIGFNQVTVRTDCSKRPPLFHARRAVLASEDRNEV